MRLAETIRDGARLIPRGDAVLPTDQWTPDFTQCVLYYKAATCSAHSHAHPSGPADPALCVGPGANYRLTPRVEADLPARQWVYDTYATDPVRVGFYQVSP